MVVAERELWLAISRLLWSFSFNEVPGEPITLAQYEGLSGRTPFPYRINITPRHDGVLDILAEREEIPMRE